MYYTICVLWTSTYGALPLSCNGLNNLETYFTITIKKYNFKNNFSFSFALNHFPLKLRNNNILHNILYQNSCLMLSGYILYNSIATFRGRPECRSFRVPDESGPLPANPFSPGHVRPLCVRLQGVPREGKHAPDGELVLRARQPDGHLQPQEGQVHSLLYVLQGGRQPFGC